jgi:hypothetical protein
MVVVAAGPDDESERLGAGCRPEGCRDEVTRPRRLAIMKKN